MKVPPMSDNRSRQDALSKLTSEVDEALKLLKDAEHVKAHNDFAVSRDIPPNLLDQCLALCEEHYQAQLEPVRTIHHLACTGGTLICKCVASMPNTQLLSEVDPLSTFKNPSGSPKFAPSDMVSLMRQSTRGSSIELLVDIFQNSLSTICAESDSRGLRLVLRDHAHSHFCTGFCIPKRPSLLEMIKARFSAKSIITVRDPIDSFLSLHHHGWLSFTPPSFDEYCARYAAFLETYKGLPIIRYEDFVDEPSSEMAKICRLLDLPFNPDFTELFSVFHLSGDSGRSGATIGQRSRRAIDADVLLEMENSPRYQSVLSVLGY